MECRGLQPLFSNSRLEQLPTEIRLMIWDQCFYSPIPIEPLQLRQRCSTFIAKNCYSHFPREATVALTSLYGTCRLIAMDQDRFQRFYKTNTFRFETLYHLADYIAGITRKKASTIVSMVLDYLPDPTHVSGGDCPLYTVLSPCHNLRHIQMGLPRRLSNINKVCHGTGIFYPWHIEQVLPGGRLSTCLQETVQALPQLRSVEIFGYLDFLAPTGATERLYFRLGISKHGFRLYDSHTVDHRRSEPSDFTVPAKPEEFSDGGDHNIVDYFHSIISQHFSDLPEILATDGCRLSTEVDSDRWPFQGRTNAATPGPDDNTNLGSPNTYVQPGILPNKYWQLIGSHLPASDPFRPQYATFGARKHDLWHAFRGLSNYRRPSTPYPKIGLVGEGMQPPSTFEHRDRVAREFEDAPIIWVDAATLATPDVPYHVTVAHLEDILRWFRVKLTNEAAKAWEDRDSPPPPYQMLACFLNQLRPCSDHLKRQIIATQKLWKKVRSRGKAPRQRKKFAVKYGHCYQ